MLRRPRLGLAPGLLPDGWQLAGRQCRRVTQLAAAWADLAVCVIIWHSAMGARLQPVRAETVCRPARGGWAQSWQSAEAAETGGHHGGDPGPGYAAALPPRHRRSWRSPRGCSPGPDRPSGQVPGSAASARARLAVAAGMVAGPAPAGKRRCGGRRAAWHGAAAVPPQPSPGPLASASPGPSTSISRGVGSAGGTISSGVRGVAAASSVLAGRSL